MKPIFKKVKTLMGVTLSVSDIKELIAEKECQLDDGDVFYLGDDQKITVKFKGKVVDSDDITISFEEV